MISNCGCDERGQLSGGQAGDQTGREWAVIDWYQYSGGWEFMIRHPDPAVGKMIADLAREAANNDCIGYDQSDRYTFWQRLAAVGYRPKNIKTNCETDCSAGVAAIVKAVGYLMGLTKLQNVSLYAYTGNIRQVLQAAGFSVYTDSKYLTSENYLLPGDLLLKPYWHIATNLTTGKSAKKDSKTEAWTATGTATCTDDGVNVRATPGGAVIGQMNKGQRFEIDGVVEDGWTHIKDVSSIGIGWMWSEYIKKDGAGTSTWHPIGTATCTDDHVNVRSTPDSNSNSNILGQLNKGQRFEIDGKDSGKWIHVNVAGYGIGYMYSDYVQND